jgi:two-component sensor histidine kinase
VASSLNLDVCCRAESLKLVRAALDDLDGLDPYTRDTLRLVVTELVANAVLHSDLGAEDHITVSVSTNGARVRVDVRDEGTGFTFPTSKVPGRRGLPLVQSLTNHFGISRNGITHAWAEIDPLARFASPDYRNAHTGSP